MSTFSSTVRFGSRFSAVAFVLSLGLAAGACSDGARNLTGPSSTSPSLGAHSGQPVKLATPVVSADNTTCGWITLTWTNDAVSGHVASEWKVQIEPGTTWDDDDKIFNATQYDAGASLTLELEPGSYMIRVQANSTEPGQTTGSSWSAFLTFTVLPCGGGCTFTQGYWKTHGPIPTGNNENEWPVTSLMLGNRSYTDLELLAIFNMPVQGNDLLNLAHQLIAAKLNIANGADGAAVAATIIAADALIGDLEVGVDSLKSNEATNLAATLDDFNKGLIGPGHCGDEPL